MLYLPITREWILSPVARRVYLVCTFLAMVFLIELCVFTYDRLFAPEAFAEQLSPDVIALLFLPAVTGTALLTVAMWYHWFNFYRGGIWAEGGIWKKSLWAVVLWLFGWIGAVVYHFAVYRRETRSVIQSAGV